MFLAVIGCTFPLKLSRTFYASLANELYLILVFALVEAVDGVAKALFLFRSALKDLQLLLRLEVAVLVYAKCALLTNGFIFS
jgi:hypothetical protein